MSTIVARKLICLLSLLIPLACRAQNPARSSFYTSVGGSNWPPAHSFYLIDATNVITPGYAHFIDLNLNSNSVSSNLIVDSGFVLDAPGGIFLVSPIIWSTNFTPATATEFTNVTGARLHS